jgi:hypothetical protein
MKSLLLKYIALVTVLPSLIFAAAFAITCAIECTALPWLAMLGAPLVSLAALLPIAVLTYRRAANLSSRDTRIVRGAVISSVIWGPILATWGFKVCLAMAQRLT